MEYSEKFYKKQDAEHIRRMAERIAELEAELARMKKHFRQPTHGPCCTCQQCGQYYDDCRCMLDEVATDNARLRECLKRLEWVTRFDPEYKGRRYCPSCFYTIDQGHASDCWIAEELKEDK